MNSTPAASSDDLIASTVLSWAANLPGWVSRRLIDGRDTFDATDKSFCSHRRSALAARTCSPVRAAAEGMPNDCAPSQLGEFIHKVLEPLPATTLSDFEYSHLQRKMRWRPWIDARVRTRFQSASWAPARHMSSCEPCSIADRCGSSARATTDTAGHWRASTPAS